MKRLLAMLIMLVMLLSVSAMADGTGIMVIGGPEMEAETVSMDDFKAGDVIDIAGYGEIVLDWVLWTDDLVQWNSDAYLDVRGNLGNVMYFNSGDEAKYLVLRLDILNTQTKEFNFYGQIKNIVCTYDDEYMFGGWARTNKMIEVGDRRFDSLIGAEGGFDVVPMYRTQISIVITLPNDVYTNVEEKDKPLTVSFNIGENEFTYIHR